MSGVTFLKIARYDGRRPGGPGGRFGMSFREEIKVGGSRPKGAYSRGIRLGDFLFVSGQVPPSLHCSPPPSPPSRPRPAPPTRPTRRRQSARATT